MTALLLVLLYAIQHRSKNAAIADAGWTGGMVLLTAWFAFHLAEFSVRTGVISGLAILWALRLTYHVIHYRVMGKPEDGRYAAMRAYWADRANFYFFWFFQGQAVVAFLFAMPILVALRTPRSTLALWDWVGMGIWLIAVVGEFIADHQLETFRSANPGKTCRVGLWKYSRHPNYFFEWIHWFAYVAFSIGHPHGYVAALGPIVMLIFLFKLTGIPYTEKQALKSRGEDYRDYQKTTSVFFPWPPKSSSGESGYESSH